MADKILVRSGEGVMARQAVRIAGHAEQEPPLLVCQQLLAPQGGSPTSHNPGVDKDRSHHPNGKAGIVADSCRPATPTWGDPPSIERSVGSGRRGTQAFPPSFMKSFVLGLFS
jgi:hypothetical protein